MRAEIADALFECITNKYGNFIKGKIYPAWSRAQKLDGTKVNFLIEDEDGDMFGNVEDEKNMFRRIQ